MNKTTKHVDDPDTAVVWLIGTLDTKGTEIGYLRQLIQGHGLNARVIDIGVLGKPGISAEVTRNAIATLGGSTIEDLNTKADRGSAITAMQNGLVKWMRDQPAGSIGGVIAIGGSAGTAIASAGMRELPIGVPKLLVSTMASGDVRPYVGTSDITMMYSVTDFTGLNRLSRAILGNAARAIAGMCSASPGATQGESESLPLVGATMFGVTTPCVQQVQSRLEPRGFELLVFHATGTGGQAMERLIRDGFIRGVVDITTTELADELVGGVLTAGPHRLEAAGAAGIPQVVSLGALDMVNFGPPETIPAKFRDRLFYQHNSAVTLMRTTTEENAALGTILAEKLNCSRGRVTVLIPLRGVSAIDAEGKPFYDPRADKALFDALRSTLESHIELIELDMHINDVAFAERVVFEFLMASSFSHPIDRHAQLFLEEPHVS